MYFLIPWRTLSSFYNIYSGLFLYAGCIRQLFVHRLCSACFWALYPPGSQTLMLRALSFLLSVSGFLGPDNYWTWSSSSNRKKSRKLNIQWSSYEDFQGYTHSVAGRKRDVLIWGQWKAKDCSQWGLVWRGCCCCQQVYPFLVFMFWVFFCMPIRKPEHNTSTT